MKLRVVSPMTGENVMQNCLKEVKKRLKRKNTNERLQKSNDMGIHSELKLPEHLGLPDIK